jgi:hypothetical protein
LTPNQVKTQSAYVRLLLVCASVGVGLCQGALAADDYPFIVKNTTGATICKLQAGPGIVADTAVSFQEAFAAANKGNLNAMVDPYDLVSCTAPAIPKGYNGRYKQIWNFDLGAGIKPGKEASFNWKGQTGSNDYCKLDVIMTIQAVDSTGITTTAVYMKNEDFCAGSPHLVVPSPANSSAMPSSD